MKKLSKQKVKERRKVGIVKAYMSRASAVKKLQIPLADFRRLCILKGVYPVEPKNKSKLTGGNTRRKTYFFTRDIQFLINDPLLIKFWEFKVFMKRLTKAKGRHDREKFNQVNENKPFYKLDGVVKERYPRFVDALRDCDDALSMCFLFAMFPKGKGRPDELIDLSKTLTTEFMDYVVASRTLRKVFISIKGYYYQAEIMNQSVTWMVPHQFVIDRVTDVDLNVMKTFTEFYITLLGFINYKLKKSLNIETSEQQPDVFEEFDYKDDAKTVQENLALERLFKGLKFFLNREVPKDSIAFVIRCFGGEVSWNGDNFPESDTGITHHIVDRESLPERRIDRVYIQPQWVYDSVNMRQLLPTADYLMGAKLPPHLSPFAVEKKLDSTPKVIDSSTKEKTNKSTSKSRMAVKKSKIILEDKEKVQKDEDAENRRLGIMMIPKKKKRLFDRITKTNKERAAKDRKLGAKRAIVDAVMSRKQKAK